ncbi:unnamed protein product [Rhizophagus irregularis]|nr:unnamed protein product [Rhizophagus irregularis]
MTFLFISSLTKGFMILNLRLTAGSLGLTPSLEDLITRLEGTELLTPIKLPKEYCKSLTDINFFPSKLRTYVHKFCNSYLKLDQQSILELYKYIQVVTKGYAGLNGDGNRLKLCEDTYINGKVPFSINNLDPDASYLVKTGQYYGVEDSVDIAPTDLYHFIVKVFTAMCNENSGKILREMLGFGYDGRILEQTWQKEFYRIGTWVLGKNKFLSCEVGSVFGCKGRIDFYVNKLE